MHAVPFRENALFRQLPPLALESAVTSLRLVELGAGETIFSEGDAPDFCYLVESGSVRLTKLGPDGMPELLAVAGPGDFFGELALYDESCRSATATAAVPTVLGGLNRTGFEQLRRIAPLEVTSTLAEVSIARVRQTNELLVRGLAEAGRLRSVGADLSTLSHNLRSPLGTIRNAADMLSEWITDETPTSSQTKNFVRIIQDTADRGLAQIDQLMARLRGEASPVRRMVPVNELLRELRNQVGGLLSTTSVQYDDQQVAFRGPVFVERAEWVSALANLVKNSVEALESGNGVVRVTVSEEGEEVVFAVADTGCGVPPAKLARFFDRGFTDGKVGGTGLGTAHVRSVAESHGGRVEVESEVGRGTTVRMRIPRTSP